MHFSNAAALLAFSSISAIYAAPLANPQDELNRRQINYHVVNVDGDSDSSAVPEIETVTKTAESTVTAAGAPVVLQTVTVTATPSLVPYSPGPPSSTPISHQAPPPGESFIPAQSNGFFRRGLNAAGNPVQFVQNYIPSPSVSFTPSATPYASPLVARQYGDWASSASVPLSPSFMATPSASMAARQFGGWNPSSIPTPSATPSVSPSGYVYARGYGVAPWGTPSASPSVSPSVSLVARQFGARSPISVATPSGSPSGLSTPVAPTSFPVKRDFDNHVSPSGAPTPTPSASFSIPRSSALLY
ncbi:hypothetical protein N7520_007912 [Penicillium odoratum]|uniref:uncharacterized protein n=1 Tax=Penicillium odoratum TaxID=1167516 RepID=UPI002547B2B0|nr:uncharacterized protein N7520_007912 [Penicillium odoratum]KAJ5760756.1 hypothetical protein N7520_007912 [Penicillium odoratum]